MELENMSGEYLTSIMFDNIAMGIAEDVVAMTAKQLEKMKRRLEHALEKEGAKITLRTA